MSVQASVQLLVDFHNHDGDTKELAALTDADRKAFLEKCTADLQGGDVAKFLSLCNSGVFKPALALSATGEPTLAAIHAALVAAVAAYNAGGFGMLFDIVGATEALPDYACVQWVWINGEWVRRYNYDLTPSALNTKAPHTLGGLTASYRVTLGYTTPTVLIASLSSTGTSSARTSTLKTGDDVVVPHSAHVHAGH
jgi:hypothetical protein